MALKCWPRQYFVQDKELFSILSDQNINPDKFFISPNPSFKASSFFMIFTINSKPITYAKIISAFMDACAPCCAVPTP
jgi:hypothetical protein